MPPEVLTGRAYTFSFDVWGVGATAFHFLTGKTFFEATDLSGDLDKIRECSWKFPEEPAVSAEARDFVEKVHCPKAPQQTRRWGVAPLTLPRGVDVNTAPARYSLAYLPPPGKASHGEKHAFLLIREGGPPSLVDI